MNRVIIVILQLLYCAPGYLLLWQDVVFLITVNLSLDPFSSIVASLKAMQCVKLKAKGRFSHCGAFVIAPLRSATVRFVLRELSIFLLCFDYATD